MRRRTALALAGTVLGALAGCAGGTGRGGTGGPTTTETATPTATSDGSTSRSPLPEECPTSPDVTGLPERPAKFTGPALTDFVEAYERTLALARHPAYVGFDRFEHVDTERGGGHRVYLYVVPRVEPGTPDGNASAGNRTVAGTSTPASAEGYNVGYFLTRRRMLRDERPDALSLQFGPYDGFDPREEGDLVAC